ncbi:polysaccharide pyruvyl transferase family protein [Limosilactobacillus sp.]|uniref:polysaccharide pyruvyl transferase family protein n=1 Tax=Limosilactobacillus sp. TaxID=2773925 RepID=UPI00345EABE7
MKKIGVITWFRYENYGTVLQAVALQEYLKSQKVLPSLIETPKIEVSRRKKKRSVGFRIKRKLSLKYILLKYGKYLKVRTQRFHNAIYGKYDIQPVKDNFSDTCNKFDLLICGSDQIWNPDWFNDYYFANFPRIVVPKISYAPSFGVGKLPATLLGSYYNALKQFKRLSVREKSSQKEIQETLGINCSMVVDPVLLVSNNKWLSLIKQETVKDEGYAFCYLLGENNNHWKAVQLYAKNHNLKLKIIPMQPNSFLKRGKKIYDAGPSDFLKSIANASIIFTDSFHASVFSIIFHKPFYVFERTPKGKKGSQNSRIYNLLKVTGLEQRLISYGSRKVGERGNVNYYHVFDKLDPIIKSSKEYLNNAISENI